jgi:hypothetical protein
MKSVPITIKAVRSNPAYGEVYSIQNYVIKFFSDLRQVNGFLRVLIFPPRYSWTIVESGVKDHNPNPIKESVITNLIGNVFVRIRYLRVNDYHRVGRYVTSADFCFPV